MLSKKIFVCLGFLLLFVMLNVGEAAFSRNLKVGDAGSDVLELQKALNSLGFAVSAFGPGSQGQETNYFGEKTRLAVVTFQERYRDEVLTPAGLSVGSGFVGFLTRNKLNSLISSVSISSPSPSPAQSKPFISAISPSEGKNGAAVTLFGSGFDQTQNTILVAFEDSRKYENITSDGKTIVFTMDSILPNQLKKQIDDLSSSGKKKVLQQIPNIIPLVIQVKTPSGISNPVTFNLELHSQ